MTKSVMVLGAVGAWIAAVSSVPQAAPPQQAATAARGAVSAGPSTYRPVLDRYCVSCHNDKLKTGDLSFEGTDLNNVAANAEVWERVVRKLRSGMMPPQGVARPDQATSHAFASSLETTLDRAAAASPNPGRPILHRVNRAEYANAIQDVLALDVDASQLLPADDSSFGFDNIGEVLGFSPSLQERYLSAAGKIAALAIGSMEIAVTDEPFKVREDLTQTQHIDGLPLGTRGGQLFHYIAPLDADYVIRATIFRTNEGNIRGMGSDNKLVVTVDGEQVFEDVTGPADQAKLATAAVGGGQVGGNQTTLGDMIDNRWQVRVPIKAGPHEIGVTFVMRNQAAVPDMLQPFLAKFSKIDPSGVPQIDFVKIAGPYNPTGPGDTPSRRRVFMCRPAPNSSAAQEEACAKNILNTLGRRAYRRPVTDADTQAFVEFYQMGRKKGSFDQGIELGLRYMLASPDFVFRVERDAANVAPGAAYRVSDLELASRLSFFLWSTVPDDQLLDTASKGRLRDSGVLAQQVKRMIADPHAKSLTDNFAGQWLQLRNLKNFVPDVNLYPDWDDNLRQSMRQETEMLFESIIHEDRSVLDLMTADYTFVNERLARHYGIPGIRGSQFRRVAITDEARKGLLGQGSILTVTSRVDRTSVVLRGKWILENLLASPPPAPPANVPPLADTDGRAAPKTVRARMELHRSNPVCASCHKMMDPIGFALEHFDAIGAWRDSYEGSPIDSSGQLSDGTPFDGVTTLRQVLLRRPETFVQTLTEKMLTYALGRGLDYHDMPVVRGIVRDAAASHYKFSSIVMGIVNSVPFQMRVKAAQEPVATSAAREMIGVPDARIPLHNH